MIATEWIILGVSWIGHAVLWTAFLNRLYGRALPKRFLKLWRLFTGVVILAFPLFDWQIHAVTQLDPSAGILGFCGQLGGVYTVVCAVIGGLIFPLITALRWLRRVPGTLNSEHTRTIDYWRELGQVVRGNGKNRLLTYLPFNSVFRLDITEVALKHPSLPQSLDGLSILMLSDLHLHGTPSQEWFAAIFDELSKLPKPDLVALVGDYIDSDTHHNWLAPLLKKLSWNEAGIAILGNHDYQHQPDRIRSILSDLGYLVLGNSWQELLIRGEPVQIAGHEGPWFPPSSAPFHEAPVGPFRICLSHTPDHFQDLAKRNTHLILSGHTHGGGIRLPIIGSIFIPCTSGRKYDDGVFQFRESVLVVCRGMSGKEPIRFRCHPQAIRLILNTNG
jgi:uncharacterized protein